MKNAASGVQTGKRQGSVIHSNDITNQGGNQVFGIFERLQDIAERLGTVEEAHMYNNGAVMIDVTGNGKKYHISMFVKEDNDDKVLE